MAETKAAVSTAPAGGYGYASDEVKQSPFNFGLNAGVTKLKKFEWIPNAGKDGAEQEALDIVFNINGTDKSYRMFPVVKAFGKNNEEITDPNAQEFKDAITDFNARITHILHAFMDSDTVRAGLSRPITSFKEFCTVAMSLLPKDYAEKPLDIFMQFQWQPDEGQNKTYLEIPKKMKYGAWLKPAQPGKWKEVRKANPSDNDRDALYYVNEEVPAGQPEQRHPFVKNGWFMQSNFAHQQKEGGSAADSSSAATTGAVMNKEGEQKASSW